MTPVRERSVWCSLVVTVLVLGTSAASADQDGLTDLELAALCDSARAVESMQERCAADPANKEALEHVCAAYESRALVDWRDITRVRHCVADARAARASAAPAAMKRDSESASRAVESPDAEPARGLGGAALQTAILRGAAEFFVTRAEQELSLFAAEFVGDQLCDEEHEFGPLKLASVFEQSCELLRPENGPALGATPAALREAARADLEALPERLAEAFPKQSQMRCGIALGWRFAREAVQGADLAALLSDPEPIVSDLAVDACSEDMLERLRDIAGAIEKVRRLPGVNVASAVRSGTLDFLVSRSGDYVVRQQAVPPAAAGEAGSAAAPARSPEPTLSDKGKAVREVLRRLGELDRAVRVWEAKPERAQTAAMVAAGLRCIEPVLRYVTGAKGTELADLTTAIRGVEQIGARQYVAAVVTFGKLSALKKVAKQPTVKALVGLGATLAQAESREAVRTAFEDTALPLQSWRRKNAERVGFTLTGFVGFHFAHEVVLGDVGGAAPDDGLTFAPALMVGVDVHGGIGAGWRLGAHFNVLDLGALASIRLDDASNAESTSDEEPDVRVEQVFAPGVFPYVGVGPFAFGPEVSFVPSLRETRARMGGAREPLDVLRVGVLLTVDVSVLPLL